MKYPEWFEKYANPQDLVRGILEVEEDRKVLLRNVSGSYLVDNQIVGNSEGNPYFLDSYCGDSCEDDLISFSSGEARNSDPIVEQIVKIHVATGDKNISRKLLDRNLFYPTEKIDSSIRENRKYLFNEWGITIN